jgi:hypothetical protein
MISMRGMPIRKNLHPEQNSLIIRRYPGERALGSSSRISDTHYSAGINTPFVRRPAARHDHVDVRMVGHR